MKRLRASLIGIALITGTGVTAYQLFLTKEAKQALRAAVTSVGKTATALRATVQEQQGVLMEEEKLPNSEQTLREWDALGY